MYRPRGLRREGGGNRTQASLVLLVCCYDVLLYRSRFVSVVFDFNASLNAVAPVSPILLAVELMRIEEWIVYGCHLCVVSFVLTTQIEFSECCV